MKAGNETIAVIPATTNPLITCFSTPMLSESPRRVDSFCDRTARGRGLSLGLIPFRAVGALRARDTEGLLPVHRERGILLTAHELSQRSLPVSLELLECGFELESLGREGRIYACTLVWLAGVSPTIGCPKRCSGMTTVRWIELLLWPNTMVLLVSSRHAAGRRIQ